MLVAFEFNVNWGSSSFSEDSFKILGLYLDSWKVPQHRRIRKSASSDSLLEAVKSDTVQNEKNPPTVFEDLTAVGTYDFVQIELCTTRETSPISTNLA